MARKKSRGNRGPAKANSQRPKRGSKAHGRARPAARGDKIDGPAGDNDLIGMVRRVVADGEPLALLSMASSLLSATDPRSDDPFTRCEPDHSREEFITSLIGVDLPETGALLAAISLQIDNELTAARIRLALASRQSALPAMAAELAASPGLRVLRAARTTDPLADGENIVLDAEIPFVDASRPLHPFCAIVYVDHNLGSVAKSGFVLPMSLDQSLEAAKSAPEADVIEHHDIPLADAAAKITEAIRRGAMMYPPLEADTWPGDRPLIEAIVRTLPTGGAAYTTREWSEAEIKAIAKRFAASTPRGRLTRDDMLNAELVLQYGANYYGPGDPLHFSPASVEMLLLDWIPRKVMATPDDLATIPDLLRRLVPFSHAERGLPRWATTDTLDAIDDFEGAYLDAIEYDENYDAGGSPDLTRILADLNRDFMEILEREVGGAEILGALDTAPLPDEALDLAGVPADLHDQIAAVAGIFDPISLEIGGVEFRTVCRRLLTRMARGDAAVFRRKARTDITAAAVCWVAARGNRMLNSARGLTAKDLWARFAVSAAGQRGVTLRHAAGLDPHDDTVLGTPELLTSATRERIVQSRDRIRERAVGGSP